MQQLSGLDATFLYLETPQMPMHVGALHVFELPAGFKGRFATALRQHMAARLPIVPALRRKLWWMPLNLANPAWVDADPDLRQHIVEIRLPRVDPGSDGMAALHAQVSQLHTVLLDRKKPLWKFHIFEGLPAGADGRKRVGMYSQLHHAAVDGQAAVALANAILDLTPQARVIDVRSSPRPRTYRIEMAEMLRGVLGNQAQKVAAIVRGLPSTIGTLKNAATQAVAASALLGGGRSSGNLSLAPRTALNASVTDGRAFASVSLPLAPMKALGRAHEGTINDMVLMVCSSALRRYFARKRVLPKKSLVAAVPVSLRAKGDTSPDNQASISLISLGTQIADPMRRLAHIKAASGAMKSTMGSVKSILPTDFPSLGLPWLMEALARLYGKAKVADHMPLLANVVISNVPGPAVPLYLAGARMLTNYPTSIIVHGLALNITVQSYDGALDFGLMADAQAMPDVADFANDIRVAFDDLQALPRPGDPDHEDTPAPLTVTKATRQAVGRLAGGVAGALAGAVGKASRKVVGSAVERAVSRRTLPAHEKPVSRPPRVAAPSRKRGSA